MSDSENEEIEPSVLGTKEFWDKHYSRELKGFIEAEETHQQVDVGNECWFDRRIVRAVTKYFGEEITDRSRSVIDIGCGNGALLRELANLGFGNLHGVDYSETAVELANKSNASKKEWAARIRQVFCADLCVDGAHENLPKYDVGIDVGTYDAITLRPPEEIGVDSHKKRVANFVKNVSLFVENLLVIASCNWTTQELCNVWGNETNGWQLLTELPTPSFQFGGRAGRTVTCVVFKKKET